MNLQDININDLTNHYAKLRDELETQETSYKDWKRKVEGQKDQIGIELLRRMNEQGKRKIETAIGTFSITTKNFVSVAAAETFTNWLKQDAERLKYAVIKARNQAVIEYVEEHGEAPEGVSYERVMEVIFRRHS